MKEKNVGKIEGYIRLTLAVVIIITVFMQSEFGLFESFGVITAFCLVYNFFYSHCFGWDWIGMSTYKSTAKCPPEEKS